MKRVRAGLILAGWMMGAGTMAWAQAAGATQAGQQPAGAQPGAQQQPAAAGAGTPRQAPLKLQRLGEQATPSAPVDPFPPVNAKFFTATTPTVETVNGFLRSIWGFDPNRVWRVEGIQTTAAAGVSKVTVFVTEKTPNAKVQNTQFFVLPDGKHAIADGVVSFGATPFAEERKLLQERADGPSRGAASKDLMLVEFSDLQCPRCKEAQGTMDQLVKDFPNARVVYQSFPLVEIHPASFEAAAYGVCVAKQKNDAFFPFAQAVFDTQALLTPEDTDKTLAAAVTKAGLDPAVIAACAKTPATKDAVTASIKLATDAGIDQTPLLAVNGHVLPLAGIPYETLKQIIAYQAQLDGVSTGAAAPAAGATVLKPRVPPSLSK